MNDLIQEAVSVEKRSKKSRFEELLVKLHSVKEKLHSITPEEWEVVNDIFKVAGKQPTKNVKVLNQRLAKVDEMIEKVETCKKLEKEFRIVTLDKRASRSIPRPKSSGETKKIYNQRIEILKNPKIGEELWEKECKLRQSKGKHRITNPPHSYRPIETISIPLVWATKIPAQASQSINRGYHKITAKTPEPTAEAVKLLAKHRDNFDHMEVWWVPKDVLVEVIPPKQPVDPILVGAIKTPKSPGSIYFELCRWEDEGIEIGWWSKEGY